LQVLRKPPGEMIILKEESSSLTVEWVRWKLWNQAPKPVTSKMLKTMSKKAISGRNVVREFLSKASCQKYVFTLVVDFRLVWEILWYKDYKKNCRKNGKFCPKSPQRSKRITSDDVSGHPRSRKHSVKS